MTEEKAQLKQKRLANLSESEKQALAALNGYDVGWGDGYEQGYKDGVTDGHKIGWGDGYKEGYEDKGLASIHQGGTPGVEELAQIYRRCMEGGDENGNTTMEHID